MPILKNKQKAKEHAAELAEKYYVEYGDDPSTYQLVDRQTGKAAAVELGGLGTGEGLFTPQRRLKKLVGREVQRVALKGEDETEDADTESATTSNSITPTGNVSSTTAYIPRTIIDPTKSNEYLTLKKKYDDMRSSTVGDVSYTGADTPSTKSLYDKSIADFKKSQEEKLPSKFVNSGPIEAPYRSWESKLMNYLSERYNEGIGRGLLRSQGAVLTPALKLMEKSK